jgi:aminoglycoside 6'-N-acetyltransferase I
VKYAVRPAYASDAPHIAGLRVALWPESSVEEHTQEALAWLDGKGYILPTATFVAEAGGELIGFIEAGQRSYADGCDAATPAGYIEGWFVSEGCRRQGVGTSLIRAAEDWARARGCAEMASDVELENEVSQRAHTALGYEEVVRTVIYRKPL